MFGTFTKYILYSNDNSGTGTIFSFIYYTDTNETTNRITANMAHYGIAAGSWYHSILSFDNTGNYIRMLNGNVTHNATVASFRNWQTNFGSITVGGILGETKIPIVRIYDRPLSIVEMSKNYKSFQTRFN